jgi:hypothetical protein
LNETVRFGFSSIRIADADLANGRPEGEARKTEAFVNTKGKSDWQHSLIYVPTP